jgi:ferredoxin-nitrite reductase
VRDAEGKRRQAYDVLLRGALGPSAAIGRPVFRRIPSEELDEMVERLVAAWLGARSEGESFRSFCDRHSDDELGVLIGREPARSRRAAETSEEEEAA